MLKGVTIVARHGARYPNKSEMRPFSGVDAVDAQWRDGATGAPLYASDDNLTALGREQMVRLGDFLGRKYGAFAAIEWHSSTAGRCVESGAAFGRGFTAATQSAWPARPDDSYDRDAVFRPWDAPAGAYRDHLDSLKDGSLGAMRARAEAARPRLAALWLKIGVAGLSAVDALYFCCYLHCVIECERYSEAPRDFLTSRLDAADTFKVDGHARWLWERRFHQCGHERFIGSALWDRASSPPADEAPKLRLFSGHDYSILAMLAAAGACYCEETLAFGAYVVIEHYDAKPPVMYVVAAPFADGTHATVDDSRRFAVEPHCWGLWRNALDVIEATEDHAFLARMLDGSLETAAFKFYIEQDALYLVDFARALRLVASRADVEEKCGRGAAAALLGFADGCISAERDLHLSFFQEWGSAPPQSQAPHTQLYTATLLAATATADVAVALAALLPCFVVYNHVGALMLERRRSNAEARPAAFDRWIDLYGGPEFHGIVATYRAIVETAANLADAQTRESMKAHFRKSAQLEWMFWDQGLTRLDWPFAR
ncbi:hypothetical protein M885DRAFT_576270 [Pelagophyceae sp. CCMP2097]|nr:hypothetical protein M885DRAFT_576270 [Pelagophyceae sp. CCMP2097]